MISQCLTMLHDYEVELAKPDFGSVERLGRDAGGLRPCWGRLVHVTFLIFDPKVVHFGAKKGQLHREEILAPIWTFLHGLIALLNVHHDILRMTCLLVLSGPATGFLPPSAFQYRPAVNVDDLKYIHMHQHSHVLAGEGA